MKSPSSTKSGNGTVRVVTESGSILIDDETNSMGLGGGVQV